MTSLHNRLFAACVAARATLRARCGGEEYGAFALVVVDGASVEVRSYDHDAVIRQSIALEAQSACRCGAPSVMVLWPIDAQNDPCGRRFCRACSRGAIDSGLYTDDTFIQPEDEVTS